MAPKTRKLKAGTQPSLLVDKAEILGIALRQSGINPRESFTGKGARKAKQKHRKLVRVCTECSNAAVDHFGGGVKLCGYPPTKKEVQQFVADLQKTKMGFMLWILWAWRVYKIVSLVWDVLDSYYERQNSDLFE